MKMNVDATKLGGALTAFGTAIFGIPAALMLGGTTAIPKWLLLSCLVLGLLIQASGHFATALFAANTDASQQRQLDAVNKKVDDNTAFLNKKDMPDALVPIAPGKPNNLS